MDGLPIFTINIVSLTDSIKGSQKVFVIKGLKFGDGRFINSKTALDNVIFH